MKEQDKWVPSSKTARDVRVCNGHDIFTLFKMHPPDYGRITTYPVQLCIFTS